MLEDENSLIENLKDRIRTLDKENIKLTNNFLIHQYDQLKSDARDINKLIWATPIVVGAITIAILAILFSSQFEQVLLPIKLVGVIIGIALNFTLYVGLCRQRFFQLYKNRIIDDLEKRLPIIDEKNKIEDIHKQKDYEILSGLIHRVPTFFFLAGSTILFISSLVGAAIFLAVDLLTHAGIGAFVTIIFLALIFLLKKKNSKF